MVCKSSIWSRYPIIPGVLVTGLEEAIEKHVKKGGQKIGPGTLNAVERKVAALEAAVTGHAAINIADDAKDSVLQLCTWHLFTKFIIFNVTLHPQADLFIVQPA